MDKFDKNLLINFSPLLITAIVMLMLLFAAEVQ